MASISFCAFPFLESGFYALHLHCLLLMSTSHLHCASGVSETTGFEWKLDKDGCLMHAISLPNTVEDLSLRHCCLFWFLPE